MDLRVVANDLAISKSEAEYQLHCAALEWSLAEPIIINSAEDIKSKVDWKDRVEPFYHQVQNLMRFCRRLPVTLLADDVGLGKTISAGLIISELMKRNRVNKVFVVCPKILIPQWVEELESKFGISGYGAVRTELQTAHRRSESVIITTYQSATGFLERREKDLFDMLILDEAHKVRNLHGTPDPPKMATAIFKSLEARMFKYVVMLTATPIQNRLWDIYSLVDCLAVARGHKNPLGTPSQFSVRYIADGKNVARRLNHQHADEFRKIVSSYMFRTRRADAKLVFPDRQVQTNAIEPTKEEITLQQLIGEHITKFNGLEQISLLVALMSSPHALSAQLQNMASTRGDRSLLAERIRDVVRRMQTPAKAKTVLAITEDLKKQSPNWRMVIFTTRKETQRMLGEVLGKLGIRYGFISGGEPSKNRTTIESFRAQVPAINVVVSTDAGAEGVNLQAANILVNYDLPWNPMIVEQRIGRVQRIGSKFKNVWVVNIVHNNSPEQRIVVRLMEKLQVISHTVGDIEAVLEATGDSDGSTLEKQIRDMVVSSLKGQDQAAAARKAEESIERAKKLIEQHQAEMDRTLGGTQDSDEADVPMPRLTPALPTISLKDFVISALKAEGASITDCGDGLFTAKSSNLGEERFTFDERVLERFKQPGVFMGRSPILYQQCKAAFERLVQRWIDRSSAYLKDERCSVATARSLAENWAATIPGAKNLKVEMASRLECFDGQLVCRTRVANAVDSYEKLLCVQHAADGSFHSSDTRLVGKVLAKSLIPNLEQHVERVVSADPDLNKFREYYETRLKIELERSDSGDRKEKLINDLSPGITADTTAITGLLTDTQTLNVEFQVYSDEIYRCQLEVKAGRISTEPSRSRCCVTNMDYPIDCLEKCAVTGKLALREKLQRSQSNGGFALEEQMVTCEKTGKRVHSTETGTCCITKKRMLSEFLISSGMTGRTACPEHIRKCEFTGIDLIKDEVQRSDESAKIFRCDEVVTLADNRLVHKSEATRCDFSNTWYPAKDCMKSAVSGKYFTKERAAYSEMSQKGCHVSEIATCQRTGKRVLPEELGRCSVSGEPICSDLLNFCPETKLIAEHVHFLKCEETGERVLPNGLCECYLTKKKVRRSLLARSGVSGRSALAKQMFVCENTGVHLLPEEAGKCEISGKVVDRRLLETCGASRKLALRSLMVQSKASGKWLLPDQTQELPSGAIVGLKEVAICRWTRKYLRIEQTAQCNLCGLVFDRSLMNASGELKLLRECLDGNQKGSSFPEPGFLARIQPKIFAGTMMFQWISAPSHRVHIMFGKKSTFGFNSKFFAVLAEGDLNGLVLTGNVLWGKRLKGIWQETEKHPLKGP
jgi:ERCC4-related helicase